VPETCFWFAFSSFYLNLDRLGLVHFIFSSFYLNLDRLGLVNFIFSKRTVAIKIDPTLTGH